ncbi:response regulator [Brevundimonas sp. 'scallop']|uniref:response regulator n=1 Tax=Brevundimonas sp. 'scallop' TaxID=2562582 RepID=UPI0013E1063E|nr:response regulator [Brevundimonas sp. 'scallop']QIF82565.1 response regulator [Brevundimonas sp. 'scallop']
MLQSRPYGDRSILIVEDEYILRMDLVAFFSDEGFRVLEASSAEDAIELLANDPGVRVVLTDINLRGEMNGLELAKIVRHRHPPTTIFVMSSQQAPLATELASGAQFLAKPVNNLRMLKQIEPETPN